LTVDQKYNIIVTYSQHGGAHGLLQDDDDDMDEATLEAMAPEDKRALEAQF